MTIQEEVLELIRLEWARFPSMTLDSFIHYAAKVYVGHESSDMLDIDILRGLRKIRYGRVK